MGDFTGLRIASRTRSVAEHVGSVRVRLLKSEFIFAVLSCIDDILDEVKVNACPFGIFELLSGTHIERY